MKLKEMFSKGKNKLIRLIKSEEIFYMKNRVVVFSKYLRSGECASERSYQDMYKIIIKEKARLNAWGIDTSYVELPSAKMGASI